MFRQDFEHREVGWKKKRGTAEFFLNPPDTLQKHEETNKLWYKLTVYNPQQYIKHKEVFGQDF